MNTRLYIDYFLAPARLYKFFKRTQNKNGGKNVPKAKERFESSKTHLDGVFLRKEPGTELDILKATIEELNQEAGLFARTKWDIDNLTESQLPRREKIIGLAEKTKGLRGIISEKEGFKVTVFPSEKNVEWDRKLLKEILGPAYLAIVKENLSFSIDVASGYVTKKGIVITEELLEGAIIETLTKLGFDSEDAPKIIKEEVNLKVDEEKLNKITSTSSIKLPEGIKTSTTVWSIRADQLK